MTDWLTDWLMNERGVMMLQLDNSDEQAAQVRRELDSRLSAADEMTRVWSFTDHRMHSYRVIS